VKDCCSNTAGASPACCGSSSDSAGARRTELPAFPGSGDVAGDAAKVGTAVTVSLATMKPGQRGIVRSADLGEDDAQLLRAMGLRPAAEVRLCKLGEPCIVEVMGGTSATAGCVCSCRIGLARPLAERVQVELA
jgi:Fe2+ transport system protein FeoA